MVDSLNTLARSRTEALELWGEIKPFRFEDQYYLVRTHRRFLTWGFCELLCEESLRLTSVDAAQAVERAEIAVLVSDLLKDDEPVTDRRLYQLRGYAWAHDGNARRVLGDLRSADESFAIPKPGGKRVRRRSATVSATSRWSSISRHRCASPSGASPKPSPFSTASTPSTSSVRSTRTRTSPAAPW